MKRLLFLLPLLTACSGPSIVGVERQAVTETISGTEYAFDDGAKLLLIPDQGVGPVSLVPGDDGYSLSWGPVGAAATWSHTLKLEDGTVELPEIPVEELKHPIKGANLRLLLQGNGDVRLVNEGLDLEVAYGTNALAYLGLVMSNDRISKAIPDSPASDAGVRPEDKLVAIVAGGISLPLENRVVLAKLLPKLRPKEHIKLILERAGEELELDIQLGVRPKEKWNKTDG